MKPLKAAVIGLGRVGAEFSLDEKRGPNTSHVSCYANHPDISSIAICDIDQAKVTSAMRQLDMRQQFIYTDYKKMMVEFQPQIVSICTPTPTHAEITCEVAKYDCVTDILLEKPISQTIKEAEAIATACTGKRLRINYARRWSRLYKEIMPGGSESHGNPLSITGIHPGPLLRTGTHMIDLFNWAYGWEVPDSVQSFGKPELAEYMKKTDDLSLNGVINYPNGTAILLGQQMPYMQFELDLRYSNARVIIENNGCSKQIHTIDSDSYSGINTLKMSEYRNGIKENLLWNTINEMVNSISVPISAITFAAHPEYSAGTAALTLLVALGLHYSAVNNNCEVKLTDVPKNYMIRSW